MPSIIAYIVDTGIRGISMIGSTNMLAIHMAFFANIGKTIGASTLLPMFIQQQMVNSNTLVFTVVNVV